MFACACLVLALHPSAPPRVPPAPPTSEVTVSERIIQLPSLPENIEKAHAEFGPIRSGLTEGLQDLERTLIKLYACPEAGIPLPASFKASRSQAEELRFLASVVNEARYRDLEEPVTKAWEEWKAVLVENNLAQPTQVATTPIPPPAARKRESAELQMRMKGMEQCEETLVMEYKELIDTFTRKNTGGKRKGIEKTDFKSLNAVITARSDFENRIITSRALAVTANRHAPSLSKAWIPLAARLNADALQLANLEASQKHSSDAGLQALEVQARISFLERFRSALWLSSVIWAGMTTTPLPDPLRDLAPTLP